MVGFTESLNVSVAAAIVLQSITSQLRRSQLEWQLTNAQKASKKLEWTKKSIKNIDQILRRYASGK
jgi:tRNA (guanosine-2'-O-)-methyltransferase